MSDSESIEGALNRARLALQAHPDATFGTAKHFTIFN